MRSFAILLSGTAPGLILNIGLLGTAVAFGLSLALLSRYKRTLRRLMRQRAPVNTSGAPQDRPTAPKVAYPPHPVAPSLFDVARARQARCAAVYAVAGACCAALLTTAYLREAGAMKPLVFLAIFIVNVWPVVLSLNVVLGWHWTTRRRYDLVYFCVLAFAAVLVASLREKFTTPQVLILFVMLNALPTILAKTFSMRRTRGIGPTVLPFVVVVVAGLLTILHLGATSDAAATSIGGLGFSAGEPIATTSVLTLLVMAAAGGAGILFLVLLYRARRISDQSLLIDSTWLVFAAIQLLIWSTNTGHEAQTGAVWAWAAFPTYLLLVNIGLRVFCRGHHDPLPQTRLLVLRAFALESRAERVFEVLTMFWRYAGPVSLIGGSDLANATVQPDSLLEFAIGRLRRLFIDSSATLQRRLLGLDAAPDPDGRFRIHDFFCYDDTWRLTASQLIHESDAIVADFRGLAQGGYKGSRWEIEEMASSGGLARCVFLLDGQPDERQLQDILTSVPSAAANPSAQALRIVNGSQSGARMLQDLMRALFAAGPAEEAVLSTAHEKLA